MSRSVVLGLRALDCPDLSLVQAKLDELNPLLTCRWIATDATNIDSVSESIFALHIEILEYAVSILLGHLQTIGYPVLLLKNEGSRLPCLFR